MEKNGPFTKYDVEKELKNEYPNEKLFSLKTIDEYLDELLVVGFITKTKIEFENGNNLLITFESTPYGQTRYKYVKGKGPYSKAK